MQKSKFIRCFRLVSRLQSEQLLIMRKIRQGTDNCPQLVRRFDSLQRRKEKIESYYKTI
jgi:hypothetical protein